MKPLDELDMKIIDLLRKDGRSSYRSMANKVGISNVAVRDRINKLVKGGYIKGFFTLVDSTRIGKGVSVLFDITTNPNDLQEVASEIYKSEYVTRILEKAGSSQLIAHALFNDLADMQSFIEEKLYKTKGITNVSPSLILKRHKYDPSLSV
jgi:Lrp/AsnC family leucine-responsive transcriptional regulator